MWKRSPSHHCQQPLPSENGGLSSVRETGFAAPLRDSLNGVLDLHKHMVSHPAATFFMQMGSRAMEGVGIYPDDILVVDRSVSPRDGSIVVAAVGGRLVCRKFHRQGAGHVALYAGSSGYSPIICSEPEMLQIWGVVTGCARKLEAGSGITSTSLYEIAL